VDYTKVNQRGVLSQGLAEKVHAYRYHHGITQQELAEQVKLSVGVIRRVEQGLPMQARTFGRLRQLLEQDGK